MDKPFTIEDMRRFAYEAWGESSIPVVDRWVEYNAKYFDGELRPVPIIITNTLPFGKRIAQCTHGNGRNITLNVPRWFDRLLADNNTLLHEMVHQFLFERGEPAGHDSAGWRREIMRLTKMIKGVDIWAGKSTVTRVAGRPTRMNKAHPETGEASLSQKIIARWPHDGLGINLGRLG